ncbi:uncharacterized protein LOC107789017 [Nicotiana tabacum]|uniref:ELM2 domain-containing protein n=1 Tax=Nicotiana tabacum TaxID=4097 RepID=A0A1S3ZPI0_TOBAC|nr:PREDICTED: uncharacterized protein LOC107789017 [Nicotiana tabacum]XP_016466268.1 PREDICTED: uncharacterized protein LOC107789017 [Nicotiana tabacum]
MAPLEGVKKGGSIEEVALCNSQGKLIFGRYSDAEMLTQLKKLALDPCDSNVSRQGIRPLWNQMLRVRDVMALADNDCSWKKRKLQQFLKDQLRSAPGLPAEKFNQKSKSKLRRGQGHFSHASGISCLLNSVNSAKSSRQKNFSSSHNAYSLLAFEDNFQEQLSSEFSLQNDAKDFGPTSKDLSSLVDSDESVNGSDLMSRDNRTPSVASLLTLDDAIHNSSLLSVRGSRSRSLQPPRQSFRLLNFIGDHLQRFVIPVGPRFQAEVPDWTEPADKDDINSKAIDSEDSRWLGTLVWPIEIGNMEVSSRPIGKGRPHSCSCRSPGTTNCVNRHILEERLILQCDLGPAFFSWKFDEMGEQVSKAWSSKEKAAFESLVKRKPEPSGKNFLKHAVKSLPQKTGKTIINYYFNVFIPRQLSVQNRSSNNLVNISDDFADDINDTGMHKGSEGQRPEGLKSRYLCRPI